MRWKFLFVVVFVCSGTIGLAQRNNSIDQKRLLKMRDDLDNLLVANKSGSAILVKQGEIELYSFNSFLSCDEMHDKNGNNANLRGNLIQFSSQFQFNVGLSKTRRVNVGADLIYSSYRQDLSGRSSVFSIFKGDSRNVSAFTYAGPRIRVQPFRRLYNFSYQTYLWLPIASDARQRLLGSSKTNWGHSLFFYKYYNQKVGIFAQANFTFAFPLGREDDQDDLEEVNDKTEFYLPVSFTTSYVASKKNIFFASLSYSRINKDVSTIMEGADSDFVQYGLGYQRIFTKKLFANINYSGTILARNYGSWENITLGIRCRL
jgi:hypothetical protein